MASPPNDKSLCIGDRFVRAVLALGRSDKERARAAGLNPYTVRAWREDRAKPTAPMMTRVFRNLGPEWAEQVLAPFLPTFDPEEAQREMTELAERIAVRRARRRRVE